MRQYKIEIKTVGENRYEVEVTRHGSSVFCVTGMALVPAVELASRQILEDLSNDPLES